MRRLAYPLYRVSGWLVCRVPRRWEEALLKLVSATAFAVMVRRRRVVGRHLERVAGRPLEGRERRRAVRESFQSYARYWLDTFRLAELESEELDDRVDGSDVVVALDRALVGGKGAILATAHFGSWDLGGAWLADRGYPLVTVVERLRSQRLLNWFVELRRRRGFAVLVSAPGVRDQLAAALERNEVVVLVCDRDLGGRGVAVDFFGERTTLPSGPAWLARACDTPLIPVAIHHVGGGSHRGVVLAPVPVQHSDDERDDVAVTTQRLAGALEVLVSAAPEEWHLMVPNWPSDTEHAVSRGHGPPPGTSDR